LATTPPAYANWNSGNTMHIVPRNLISSYSVIVVISVKVSLRERSYGVAKIRVSHGWRGVSCVEALQKAGPQDVVLVTAGQYKVVTVLSRRLRVVATAEPEKNVLEAQVEVRGPVQMENLIIRAAPFQNAGETHDSHAILELTTVYLHGDLAVKYPVV